MFREVCVMPYFVCHKLLWQVIQSETIGIMTFRALFPQSNKIVIFIAFQYSWHIL